MAPQAGKMQIEAVSFQKLPLMKTMNVNDHLFACFKLANISLKFKINKMIYHHV